MERFRLGAKKEKRSKKERKKERLPGGFAPRPPGFIAWVPRWLSKKNRERTDDETGHFTCQEKRTFSFVKNSKIFQIL
jgi:hypothetical protein